MKEKLQLAVFSPLGRWTGNNFLFKGGLGKTLIRPTVGGDTW